MQQGLYLKKVNILLGVVTLIEICTAVVAPCRNIQNFEARGSPSIQAIQVSLKSLRHQGHLVFKLRQSLESGVLEDGKSTSHSPKDILVGNLNHQSVESGLRLRCSRISA